MFFFFSDDTSPSHISSFFFNDTAPTEIYTLSLHDALPIFLHDLATDERTDDGGDLVLFGCTRRTPQKLPRSEEHTSNSSHSQISYAVFCLKKKKKKKKE